MRENPNSWRVAKRLLSALVLVLTAASARPDSFEPDNVPPDAKPITPGDVQTRSLEPDGDIDIVKFTLNAEAKAVLFACHTLPGVVIHVSIFDSEWVELDTGAGEAGLVLAPGEYFGVVQEESLGKAVTQYTLSLAQITTTPDRFEDDDSPLEAAPLEFDEHFRSIVVGHTIAPAGDEDWYQFPLKLFSEIVIHVPTSLGATEIELYSESDLDNPIATGGSRILQSCDPGNYFVRVHMLDKNDVSGEYPFFLCRQDGPDPYEDDDTPQTATFIGTQSPKQTHNFDSENDVDWVRFFVRAGEGIDVNFEELQGNVDVRASLFSNDGVYLIQQGDTPFTYIAQETGFYHVKFENVAPWAGPLGTLYTCGIPSNPAGLIPGTIVGVVTSAEKAASIPEALVEVVDFGGLQARTNADGIYTLPGLPPGTYTLIASATGHVASEPAIVGLGSGSTELSFELTQTGAEDINGDGSVDAVDVQLVINGALGLDLGGLDGDINGDGSVDAVDVQLVINAALGI